MGHPAIYLDALVLSIHLLSNLYWIHGYGMQHPPWSDGILLFIFITRFTLSIHDNTSDALWVGGDSKPSKTYELPAKKIWKNWIIYSPDANHLPIIYLQLFNIKCKT